MRDLTRARGKEERELYLKSNKLIKKRKRGFPDELTGEPKPKKEFVFHIASKESSWKD